MSVVRVSMEHGAVASGQRTAGSWQLFLISQFAIRNSKFQLYANWILDSDSLLLLRGFFPFTGPEQSFFIDNLIILC